MDNVELMAIANTIKEEYDGYLTTEDYNAHFRRQTYDFQFDDIRASIDVDDNSLYVRVSKFNAKMILPEEISRTLIHAGAEIPVKLDMLRAIFEMCKEL